MLLHSDVFAFGKSDVTCSTHARRHITSEGNITHEVHITFHAVEHIVEKSIAEAMLFSWRRRGDSNSRAGYPTYALSRGASSPT